MDYTRLDRVEHFAADYGLVIAVGADGELAGSTHGGSEAPLPEFPRGPWWRVGPPSAVSRWMCGVLVGGRPLCFGDPELDANGFDAVPDFVATDVCTVDSFGACALDIDGHPICWGEDVDFAPPSGPFAKLFCGDGTWCGISPGGDATCWGDCQSGICDLPP